jgi:DnaK suppressor protein
MERRSDEWLLAEKDRAQADLRFANNRCARGFDVGGDTADQAHRVVGLATNMALTQLRDECLLQLERASARLRAGQYGTCESCGEPIEPARLEVMPYATTCVACKRQSEQTCRQ